jgi:hypothetical protein
MGNVSMRYSDGCTLGPKADDRNTCPGVYLFYHLNLHTSVMRRTTHATVGRGGSRAHSDRNAAGAGNFLGSRLGFCICLMIITRFMNIPRKKQYRPAALQTGYTSDLANRSALETTNIQRKRRRGLAFRVRNRGSGAERGCCLDNRQP